MRAKTGGVVLCLAVFSSFGHLARAQSATCIAHHPIYVEGIVEIDYEPGCTGHDEPELFPISGAPGSARDLTWTAVLPASNAEPVSNVGPALWFGGVVSDPKSLFGQSFVELQFYPDSIVKNCFPNGAFAVDYARHLYRMLTGISRYLGREIRQVQRADGFQRHAGG